jgi:hypothetical protein
MALLSRKWRTTTLVSSKTLLAGIAIDPVRLRLDGSLKVFAHITGHTTGCRLQSGEAAFLAFGIKTVDIAGYFHEFRRGKFVQVLKDGFDDAHFISNLASFADWKQAVQQGTKFSAALLTKIVAFRRVLPHDG